MSLKIAEFLNFAGHVRILKTVQVAVSGAGDDACSAAGHDVRNARLHRAHAGRPQHHCAAGAHRLRVPSSDAFLCFSLLSKLAACRAERLSPLYVFHLRHSAARLHVHHPSSFSPALSCLILHSVMHGAGRDAAADARGGAAGNCFQLFSGNMLKCHVLLWLAQAPDVTLRQVQEPMQLASGLAPASGMFMGHRAVARAGGTHGGMARARGGAAGALFRDSSNRSTPFMQLRFITCRRRT